MRGLGQQWLPSSGYQFESKQPEGALPDRSISSQSAWFHSYNCGGGTIIPSFTDEVLRDKLNDQPGAIELLHI